ncbi:hypothetical protein MYP_842 [Sporocytophaga myxococcoides]|uniref:HNH endonuclease n=1 Tax=Sporocytophaga myxococcoides TaxID=153721 RepID=A0A098L9L0_9BACT|nr:hypothetical protein [Sporocytophaga myxococcoides]GAL83615.1 hypothetical protein MYP_842 [Sporocytophaga myxococcoides]
MKNLKPYKEECFEIHKKAVNKKHTGELKSRLELLNPLVENEYKSFDERFSQKELHKLVSNATLYAAKEDLTTLYSYQSSVIKSVRESIRKLQVKTIISTCQNCTIDSANSFDHVLPKSKFPEFIVNPKNLFPCCTTCNSHKLNAISEDGNDVFLNLYLDELPIIQYLFVDVFLDKYSELNFRYYLSNTDNKINSDFFNVINNHYTKLHLFERMRLKSIEYISELETKILTFRHRLSLDTIINDITNATNHDKEAYGHNYWRCILEIALINSPLFIDKYK